MTTCTRYQDLEPETLSNIIYTWSVYNNAFGNLLASTCLKREFLAAGHQHNIEVLQWKRIDHSTAAAHARRGELPIFLQAKLAKVYPINIENTSERSMAQVLKLQIPKLEQIHLD